jgi:hypothetical protein
MLGGAMSRELIRFFNINFWSKKQGFLRRTGIFSIFSRPIKGGISLSLYFFLPIDGEIAKELPFRALYQRVKARRFPRRTAEEFPGGCP